MPCFEESPYRARCAERKLFQIYQLNYSTFSPLGQQEISSAMTTLIAFVGRQDLS